MKKAISVLLVCVLTVGMLCTGVSAGKVPGFSDVSESAWYAADAAAVCSAGLMSADENGYFLPSGIVTRADFADALWTLAGRKLLTPDETFNDFYFTGVTDSIPADSADALAWACHFGLLNGYGDTRLGACDPLTREQLVMILYRFALAAGLDVSVGEDTNILSYEDAFDLYTGAFPAMQWACGAGIVRGFGEYLLPKQSVTRAQTAAILCRFVSLLEG